MKWFLILVLGCISCSSAFALQVLPENVAYDKSITSPQKHLGFHPGERHVLHHQLLDYMKLLANQSDRIKWVGYGESHGHRELGQLVITSEANLKNLERIRENHLQLADPSKSGNLETESMPVVVNLCYSVHGNEASGANAALAVAYYLAAATGPEINKLLDNMVILLDPVLNPDGLDRFANWTNDNVGKMPNPDPNAREHIEPWPNGRTNYYWFDLNRDWMLLTQPESRGRMQQYHRWLPNFVVDVHEMGTDATYFFQPGVKERSHPLIPESVKDLTNRVSAYFADALDRKGSLYFTEEKYDDFYMGKGSTISDLKGAIGILFEQASARGIVQQGDNGLVSFKFAIANQVATSLAALKSALELKTDFLGHTRDFFRESMNIAEAKSYAGYRFSSKEDPSRASEFAGTLNAHAIDVYPIENGDAWFIPIRQPHYRYLEALVEQRTSFEESIFYDITAWTLPLAYNLDISTLETAPRSSENVLDKDALAQSKLGYVFSWTPLNSPRLLLELMANDVRLKVAKKPFQMNGVSFGYGSVFVPLSQNEDKAELVYSILKRSQIELNIPVKPVTSFRTEKGVDLGSSSFAALDKPKLLLMATRGMDTYTTGSIWHLLDVYHNYPITIIEPYLIQNMDLRDYTALVIAGGTSKLYSDAIIKKLENWIDQGGVLICMGSAIQWAIEKELVSIKFKKSQNEEKIERRPFASASDNRALEDIKGAIFRTDLDISHPIGYGYVKSDLPVFVSSTSFLFPSGNAYQSPLVFTKEPLLAGYASAENLERMTGSAAVVVETKGSGSVILFNHNPTFRAYWRGTEKLLLNAMLFGQLMKP